MDSVQVRTVWTAKQARTAISAIATLRRSISAGPEISSPELVSLPVSIR